MLERAPPTKFFERIKSPEPNPSPGCSAATSPLGEGWRWDFALSTPMIFVASAADAPATPGAYALALRLDAPLDVQVGKAQGPASRRRLSLLRLGARARRIAGAIGATHAAAKTGALAYRPAHRWGEPARRLCRRTAATNAPSTPRSPICQSRSPASAVRIAAAAPRICDSGRKARPFLPDWENARKAAHLPLEGGGCAA